MKIQPLATLSDSFVYATEQIAFMFAEPADRNELPPADSPYVRAQMSFNGEVRGTITVAVPKELCTVIAANMLGVEPSDEAARTKGADALQEVLNVTCGHFLTSYAGSEPVFDLIPPQSSETGESEWAALRDDTETMTFLLDDVPVLLHLAMEN